MGAKAGIELSSLFHMAVGEAWLAELAVFTEAYYLRRHEL